jgi:ATP-dependent Lhr-like helicase
MSLQGFHPSVSAWFEKQFAGPTDPQRRAWPSIQAGRHTLIAAPTGSGKTLAAFLAAIDALVREAVKGGLEDNTHVVYVSPLKALSNDIQRNLQVPLAGIQEELDRMGLGEAGIRTLVRTGDTSAAERTKMVRRPPHIVVTTPESLYILLTSEGGRNMLRTARTVIVDEIHALVGDKRGSHLALSLERLQTLVGERLTRIGLSATQRPIEEVARFLVGSANIDAGGVPDCNIIDSGHVRNLDLTIQMPDSPLEAVMSNEVWDEIYDRLAKLILEHRSTLVFVNTRRMSERVCRHLGERVGDENVTSHHGSLAREKRLQAEQRLKNGELRALVATASLELGIDIGAVDLVCQLGSTRSIATLLQRVGRSGHTIGGMPKGRIFPLTRDELVESAALLDAVRRGELDRLSIPEQPLDILAQQIVASVATDEWTEDGLFEMIRRAYSYRNLSRADFDAVVRMLAEGFTTRRGRRSAYLHHDAVNHRLRGRRGARLASITSGGAIPDTADYTVVLEPGGAQIGTVNEDFAIESMQGDIFQLGNASWQILRVEPGRVRVQDAQGQPPTIPFWLGEAPGRTNELSAAVSRLRTDVAERIKPIEEAGSTDQSALSYLMYSLALPQSAAEQIVEYLAASKAALGVMPSQQTIVFERFFDESGGTQLVIHSPFGSRLNRAWGLALRKRFCRKFNFELQAAATEDAIVLSLGPMHSFPLEDVFGYLRSKTVRDVLIQALLDAPMFAIRWRWNANRSLAVLRWNGGRKVPPQIQRMNAEDLVAAVFPDQLACAENLTGQREIPDHPLVRQTITDCLQEAMDIEALEGLLASIERGEKTLVTRELNEPSPLAQEILTARPYAFLDDAPLEERRTQAVFSRRWLDPETAADLGTLDVGAIARVRGEAWPQVETADELHDALLQLGYLTAVEGQTGAPAWSQPEPGWEGLLSELSADRRAAVLHTAGPVPGAVATGSDGQSGESDTVRGAVATGSVSRRTDLWISAERLPELLALFPNASTTPPISAPDSFAAKQWSFEEALVEVLRGRMEALGPVTITDLAASLGLPESALESAALALESEGFILRGRFTPGIENTEWCVRRLLSRIRNYTLNRLRQEIEPVSTSDFVRFLLSWQGVSSEQQPEGVEGLAAVIDQVEGFEAPAAAWEGEILPARIADYDPAWLDALCLSGRVVWTRLSAPRPNAERAERNRGSGPVRNTSIALVNRKNIAAWRGFAYRPELSEINLSHVAEPVYAHLAANGASFFADLVDGTHLLKSQVEDALAELVAWGLVVSDSFTGLRALLTPSNKRTAMSSARRKASSAMFEMEHAGRWSLVNPADHNGGSSPINHEHVEKIARILLRRYGVVFRRLLDREDPDVPWRELLKVYRRLEARGEIRGGRFVASSSGEQFALPEAVGMLRSIRRGPSNGSLISVSAADPLNLAGVITPGRRVTSFSANRVLYRDGAPIGILEAGKIEFLVELAPAAQWEAKNALVRRKVPPQLRAYLGQSA